MYVCMCVCLYVCMYVCIYIHIYICIHIYIYIRDYMCVKECKGHLYTSPIFLATFPSLVAISLLACHFLVAVVFPLVFSLFFSQHLCHMCPPLSFPLLEPGSEPHRWQPLDGSSHINLLHPQITNFKHVQYPILEIWYICTQFSPNRNSAQRWPWSWLILATPYYNMKRGNHISMCIPLNKWAITRS